MLIIMLHADSVHLSFNRSGGERTFPFFFLRITKTFYILARFTVILLDQMHSAKRVNEKKKTSTILIV